MESKNTNVIPLKLVLNLAFLNGVIAFSWLAYNNYQPKLVSQFHLQNNQTFLLWAQALVMIIIPALAGVLSDYVSLRNHKSTSVYMLGISLTSMVFMAVAFSVNLEVMPESLRVMLPIFMVVWMISMNIFHSPANSLIESFVSEAQYAKAVAIIIMFTELIYALEPIIINLIDLLGPVLTFSAGGFILFFVGWLFMRSYQQVNLLEEDYEKVSSKPSYFIIIISGLVFGLFTCVLMNVLPDILSEKLAKFNFSYFKGNHFVTIIMGVSAVLVIPMSKYVKKVGEVKSIVWGSVICVIAVALFLSVTNEGLLISGKLIYGLGYSILSVTCFPLVLRNLTKDSAAFGTGVFLGSAEFFNSLWMVFS